MQGIFTVWQAAEPSLKEILTRLDMHKGNPYYIVSGAIYKGSPYYIVAGAIFEGNSYYGVICKDIITIMCLEQFIKEIFTTQGNPCYNVSGAIYKGYL